MGDYEQLKRDIHKKLGIDLTAYKEQQMRRRINQWVERHQLKTYNQLLATLDTDLEHKQKFTDYLTINTSSFFRDTKVFDVIEKKVLPEISRGNAPHLERGASIGAEVYSIAMLMNEAGYKPALLLATDLMTARLPRPRKVCICPTMGWHRSQVSGQVFYAEQQRSMGN